MAMEKICPVLIRMVITIATALAKQVNLVTLIIAAFLIGYAVILDLRGKGVQFSTKGYCDVCK